jgi:hypothetical protein
MSAPRAGFSVVIPVHAALMRCYGNTVDVSFCLGWSSQSLLAPCDTLRSERELSLQPRVDP